MPTSPTEPQLWHSAGETRSVSMCLNAALASVGSAFKSVIVTMAFCWCWQIFFLLLEFFSSARIAAKVIRIVDSQ